MNEKRKFEHCLNVNAAVALFGSSEKSKNTLKDNPFYTDFDCGKNREGYWDRNHTALQLEDVADFFHILLCKKQCGIIFELDHSQCHERHAKNGHAVKHFNLGSGGLVPIVRDVCAWNDSIEPCRNDSTWQPSQMASHVFDESDNPPACDEKMLKHDEHDVEKNMILESRT